jgi:hypothetical protein
MNLRFYFIFCGFVLAFQAKSYDPPNHIAAVAEIIFFPLPLLLPLSDPTWDKTIFRAISDLRITSIHCRSKQSHQSPHPWRSITPCSMIGKRRGKGL